MRSLNGPEKMRLFSQIRLIDLFKDELAIPNIETIHLIWRDFFNIFIAIRDNTFPEENKIEQIQKTTFNWLLLYEKQYTPQRITPYIHIFADHLAEMIELHGDINAFSMQGLEKLNDLTTQHYFSSTNHHPDKYLKQIIDKRNRLEFINFLNEYGWYDWSDEYE